jgi:hypothetical protein
MDSDVAVMPRQIAILNGVDYRRRFKAMDDSSTVLRVESFSEINCD